MTPEEVRERYPGAVDLILDVQKYLTMLAIMAASGRTAREHVALMKGVMLKRADLLTAHRTPQERELLLSQIDHPDFSKFLEDVGAAARREKKGMWDGGYS